MAKVAYLFILIIVASCTDSKNTAASITNQQDYEINLFPSESEGTVNTDSKVTFEHAFAMSEIVAYTNHVRMVDSFSLDRGVSQVFIYQINQAKILKEPQKKGKAKTKVSDPKSIYFFSPNKLNYSDSVHVFLQQKNKHRLLKNQLPVVYHYIDYDFSE